MASSTGSRMNLVTSVALLCVFVVIMMAGPTCARPPSILSRHRRVSDQRLAEIETLLALEKMKGRVVTVPIAFGVLDPDKIGRRRRSATNDRFQTLQRILQVVAHNPDVMAEENEKVLSFPMKNEDDRRDDDGEYQLI